MLTFSLKSPGKRIPSRFPMETRSNYVYCSGRKASKRKCFEEEGVNVRIILKYIWHLSSQQYNVGFREI